MDTSSPHRSSATSSGSGTASVWTLIPKGLHGQIRDYCTEADVTIREFVRAALEDKLGVSTKPSDRNRGFMDFFGALPPETADEIIAEVQALLRDFSKVACSPGTKNTPGLLFHWNQELICEIEFDEVLRVVNLGDCAEPVGREGLPSFRTRLPRGTSPEFVRRLFRKLRELCAQMAASDATACRETTPAAPGP